MTTLYPHQEDALYKLDNGRILWGGVGTGKSRVAIAYYARNEAPRDLYIITTAKKRDGLDWEKEASPYGIGKAKDATVAGVMTIDSWNNIGRYTDVKDAFFVFDEQRLVGSGAWTKAFEKIAKHNRWILLSATPGDTWLDYIPVFVANGFYANRTQFKREHVVYNHHAKFPKVERYVGVGKLIRLRNELLVEMPYVRHTTRRHETIRVEHDKERLHQAMVQRWNVFEERPIRDVAELFVVMRKIVNGDQSRLEAVQCLMQQHPKLIVFYNFDYELEMLRTLSSQPGFEESCSPSIISTSSSKEMSSPTESGTTTTTPMKSSSFGTLSSIKTSSRQHSRHEKSLKPSSDQSSTMTGNGSRSSSSETTFPDPEKSRKNDAILRSLTTKGSPSFQVAEWNGHKHEEIPKTDRWVYLVQYTAGAEGWNCIETDTIVFFSLTYSYKMWHQAHGRIDRLNTPFRTLNYVSLLSDSVIDRAILKSLKAKQNFNERDFGPL